MSNSKKKRMSMLDSLANSGAQSPAPAGSMMTSNRALRSARDAVDAHHVWELDPATIIDTRLADRLNPEDVADLRDAIETNGQAVPILVRRHPTEPERYLLVYGRRRLEAIRLSDKIPKVRALVANLDDDSALRTQISENMARRDLSFIEKAIFAQELIESGFGNQSQVAEVLTVTKSSVSMALTIVDMVGHDLIRAIGAAHGVGRPRWEAVGKMIEDTGADRGALARVAEDVHTAATVALVTDAGQYEPAETSVQAFEAVEKAVGKLRPRVPSPAASRQDSKPLHLGGKRAGTIKRTARGLKIDLKDTAFADWLESEAEAMIQDLHARWQTRAEDQGNEQ